jgi:hypothetical protein
MKFSTIFLTQVLAWTGAAVVLPAVRDVIPARDVTVADRGIHLAARGATSMEKELITANSKGFKAYTVPKPPAKGKKVTKRTPLDAIAAYIPRLSKRKDIEAVLNEVKTGTSSDTVSTKGLGPCAGIIVTFSGVAKGKVDKIVAHIGAYNGQAAITKMTKAIYDAAVEDGVWTDNLDAGHRPEIHVTYPDVAAEINIMVKDKSITQADAKNFEATLKKVNDSIKANLDSICSLLKGQCHVRNRFGSLPAGSTIKATAAGVVSADGHPF